MAEVGVSDFLRCTFICGTDSPVSMDSSTMHCPFNKRTSQGTMLPSLERPERDKYQNKSSGMVSFPFHLHGSEAVVRLLTNGDNVAW